MKINNCILSATENDSNSKVTSADVTKLQSVKQVEVNLWGPTATKTLETWSALGVNNIFPWMGLKKGLLAYDWSLEIMTCGLPTPPVNLFSSN